MEKNTLRVSEDTTIELNEYGNVARIETEQVLSDVQGEYEKTFYYRIEKEAGLSTDNETGEQFPVYCQIAIRHEHEMTEETVEFAHTQFYPKQISEEQGIERSHITPITKETYEQETN